MFFNEFCLCRPSGVPPENLFFVRCAVRRPCAEICLSGAFLSGAGVLKKFSAGQLRFMLRDFLLYGAICLSGAPSIFFCPVQASGGARRQPAEASVFLLGEIF